MALLDALFSQLSAEDADDGTRIVVEKSFSDNREYAYITLPNQMEASQCHVDLTLNASRAGHVGSLHLRTQRR